MDWAWLGVSLGAAAVWTCFFAYHRGRRAGHKQARDAALRAMSTAYDNVARRHLRPGDPTGAALILLRLKWQMQLWGIEE
jgi:hypothetical protein